MTQPSMRRVGELINDIDEKRLKLKPPFQRRLVWTNLVKDNFLETVTLGMPFPEIFVAAGEIDPKTRKRVNWLVDGQQRITTLQEYVTGSEDLHLTKVKPYAALSPKKQTTFLDYPVAVRDLGVVTPEQITEIFRRINSTDFALKHMERLNALYTGAYRQFCEDLSRHAFFERHATFSTGDWRRMRDLDFCVILVTTMLSTYYNRSELNREYLERYNDNFPSADDVTQRLNKVFELIEECAFPQDSRVWKKTDLFTLLIEVDSAIHSRGLVFEPSRTGLALQQFYLEVNALFASTGGEENELAKLDPAVFRYLKAATKATNDRYARVDRAEVISALLARNAAENAPRSKKPSTAKRSGGPRK